MPGGNKNIKPEDGKRFSSEYQPKEKWTEKRALELGEELIAWLKDKENEGNIYFEDFLIIEKDLYRELISYLCEKFSSFSKLIKRAKEIQEIKLYKFGTADRLNAAMTKFVLINEHGKVSDNSKVDHTTKGESINESQITVTYNDKDIDLKT